MGVGRGDLSAPEAPTPPRSPCRQLSPDTGTQLFPYPISSDPPAHPGGCSSPPQGLCGAQTPANPIQAALRSRPLRSGRAVTRDQVQHESPVPCASAYLGSAIQPPPLWASVSQSAEWEEPLPPAASRGKSPAQPTALAQAQLPPPEAELWGRQEASPRGQQQPALAACSRLALTMRFPHTIPRNTALPALPARQPGGHPTLPLHRGPSSRRVRGSSESRGSDSQGSPRQCLPAVQAHQPCPGGERQRKLLGEADWGPRSQALGGDLGQPHSHSRPLPFSPSGELVSPSFCLQGPSPHSSCGKPSQVTPLLCSKPPQAAKSPSDKKARPSQAPHARFPPQHRSLPQGLCMCCFRRTEDSSPRVPSLLSRVSFRLAPQSPPDGQAVGSPLSSAAWLRIPTCLWIC